MNEQKQIEEMAEVIKSVMNNQVFHDGKNQRIEIATALHNAGYRKEDDNKVVTIHNHWVKSNKTEESIRAEVVKEFVEKVKIHINGTITGYEQFVQAEEELNGTDTNTYIAMKSNIEIYKGVIGTIENIAKQYEVEKL